MRSLVEDIGLMVLSVGVGMIYLPAGVIVAGLALVLAANVHDVVRHRAPAADDAAADVQTSLTVADWSPGTGLVS